MTTPTDGERLEYLRREARWYLPEDDLTDRERAFRAEYEALVEQMEGANPRR